MTESNYQYPGDVREPKNFQCCHCPKILSTPQGLCGHLYKVHNIEPQNVRHKTDWETTDEVADNNKPSINRNVSISGDKTMKSDDERKFNLKCLVEGCGKIYSSSVGMSQHQMSKHNQGSKQDENWEWTTDPVTFKNKRAMASQARKGIGTTATAKRPTRRQQVAPKPTPLILSPDSKYIEISAVIRVPIEIGQPEILQS